MPLSAGEKDPLKQWIDAGAVWGSDPIDPFAFTTETRAGYDWWSLQPRGEFQGAEIDPILLFTVAPRP